MTKEEIINKCGIALENFSPRPDSAILVTIDPLVVDVVDAALVIENIRELYPDYSILSSVKGIDIK